MASAVEVNVPSHLKDAVPDIEAMFKVVMAASSTKSGYVEVEGRFGQADTGGFNCGVTATFMDACLQRMETFSDWKQVTPWTLTYDFFHNDKHGVAMRTTRECTGGKISMVHLRKTALQQHQLVIEETSDNSPSHVRVGISSEEPVAPEDMPDIVTPTYVRRKIRKSFSVEHWTFDFTKTWSGKSKAEVDQVFMNGEEPVYEMEIEILNIADYFRLPHHSSMYVAISLLLKICDMLPHKNPRLRTITY